MFPPSKAAALLAQLRAEDAMTALNLAAYAKWAALAELAVLASPTPDPHQIGTTQRAWEFVLDNTILYGLGLIYAYEFFAAYAALGGVVPGALTAAGIEETYNNAARARADTRAAVARWLEQPDTVVAALDDQLDATTSVRDLQARYLSSVRNRMVNTPDAVFRDISRDLDKGLAEGASVQDLTLAVQKHLDLTTGDWAGRAELVARTETVGAMSAATIQAAQLRNAELESFGAGEVLEQLWLCTIDGRTRNSHFAADGQRVPLGGQFLVGRSSLRYPGDPDAPVSETANCRCRTAVLAEDEALPDEIDRHTERSAGDATVRNRAGTQADEIAKRAADGVIRARDDAEGVGRVAASAAPRSATLNTEPATEEIDVTTKQKLKAALAELLADFSDDDFTDPVSSVELAADTSGEDADGETFTSFTSVLALIGETTDDGRMLANGLDFRFRDFPLPLMWQQQSEGGHFASFTIGVIESAAVEGNKVTGSGYLLNSPEALEAADQIKHGVTGPSVDLGDTEWMLTDENGKEIDEEEWWDNPDMKVIETVTSAKLLGATLVSTPAFGGTSITLGDAVTRTGPEVSVAASLVASATATYAPPTFPAEFFTDPKLDGPTYPQIDKNGRLFGHLAAWNTCHIGIQDRCVMAPHSSTDYAWFHTSPPVLTDDGTRAKVGRLTVGGGHAPGGLRMGPAVAHYDETGTCFAFVHVGEDEHGIWFSGVPAPNATPEQITEGLMAPLSGDWRNTGAGLELVAALAVNTGGFPIIASGATDTTGAPISLVASLGPCREETPGSMEAKLSTAAVRDVARAVVLEMRAADGRRAEAVELIRRSARAEALALIDQGGQ